MSFEMQLSTIRLVNSVLRRLKYTKEREHKKCLVIIVFAFCIEGWIRCKEAATSEQLVIDMSNAETETDCVGDPPFSPPPPTAK